MNKKKWGAALGAVLMGILLAGAAVPPAHALSTYTRPPAPSAGMTWGAPRSYFPVIASTAAYALTSQSSWSGGRFTVNDGVSSGATVVAPIMMEFGEPVYRSDIANVAIPIKYTRLLDNRVGSQNASLELTSAQPQYQWRCQATEWATTQTSVNGGSANQTGGTGGGPAGGAWSTVQAPTAAACPFIVGVRIRVTTYANGTTTPIYSSMTWGADLSYRGGQFIPDTPPGVIICRINVNASADCPFLLGPLGEMDGTDGAQVCANAPVPAWLDFSWLGAWVQHYARCLFYPVNGWDRGHWISTAWAGTGASQLLTVTTSIGSAFTFASSCGVIFSTGGTGPIKGFTINTCDWAEWSAIRVIIGIGLAGMFAWWAIGFVSSLVTGVLNKRVPNPLVDDGGSK